MSRRLLILVGVFTGPFLAHASSAQTAPQRVFAVEPGGQLRIDAASVDIVVTGDSSRNVAITVEGTPRAAQAVSMQATQNADGAVVVTARHTRTSWVDWFWAPDARLSITVPDDVSLHVDVTSGDIQLSDIAGDVTGKTSSGDIHLQDMRGALDLHTSSGDIVADGLAANTRVITSSGDLNVRRSDGAIEARTGSGDVHLQAAAAKAEVHTTSGDIRVETTAPDDGLNLSSSSGDIDVYAPRDLQAPMDLATRTGSISNEFEKDEFENARGDHTTKIQIRSLTGDIGLHVQ